jgi:hypothetical protein
MRQAAVGHPQPNKRLERMRAGTFVANSMRPNQAIRNVEVVEVAPWGVMIRIHTVQGIREITCHSIAEENPNAEPSDPPL